MVLEITFIFINKITMPICTYFVLYYVYYHKKCLVIMTITYVNINIVEKTLKTTHYNINGILVY